MTRSNPASTTRQRELEQLLEAISTGSIADAADLDELQQELLRSAYPQIEELEAILDLVRGQSRDER
jgi:hypothetical protein